VDKLDKALEPIKKHFIKHGPGPDSQYIVKGIDGTCMLRLDWELAYDGTQEGLDEILNNREKTVGMMVDFMKIDLEDLMVNGDVHHVNDALLKCLDGEKKKGKEAVEVLMPHASYYQQVQPKKNSVEFTLYCRFGLKF
jgi:hypothetical protein